MKNYFDYAVADYLQDDDFLHWVLSPDEEANKYWQLVQQAYPQQRKTIFDARELVLQIRQAEEKQVAPATMDEMWAAIESRTQTRRTPYPVWLRIGLGVAAAIVLAIFGWQYLAGYDGSDHTASYTNTTTRSVWVTLPDSSKVALQPGSTIRYTNTNSTPHREVKLTGRAFFQVTRDPDRPFLVITHKMVTQVVGTSFWVRANTDLKGEEVDVVTGKVSVRKKSSHQSSGQKEGQVLLLPNQRVLYSSETDQLTKGLVPTPLQVHLNLPPDQLLFDDTSFEKIATILTRLYGIPIQLDENLSRCTFTGDVNALPLYDTLRLICRSVNARYEIRGTEIVIIGKGCI